MAKAHRRGKKIEKDKIDYIRENCYTMSDEAIAKHLKINVKTATSWRRRLGVEKGFRGEVKENIAELRDNGPVGFKMNEKARLQFYKTQFASTLYYQNLKRQFTKDEIDFYLEEWAALCVQFEDVVATEKRQIDEYIKMTILGNKILNNIKVIDDEIAIIQKAVYQHRDENPDIANDPLAQERDEQLMSMITMMNAQSKSITNDYKNNLDMRTKLLQELNARRKDRVDQITKRGSTFLSVLEEFRNKEIRKTQGRYMELIKLATAKKKQAWRKPIMYEDGTRDCVLMDEHSELPEGNISLAGIGEKSKIIDVFNGMTNRSILVVEDDGNRHQFFAHIFGKHKLDWAADSDAAIRLLTKDYELICLDYDLAFGGNSKPVVEHILRSGLCKNAYVLIHSENEEGAKEINALLENFKTERIPFYQLKKDFIDEKQDGQKDTVDQVTP